MSHELLALIAANFICNAAAEQAKLPHDQALACAQNFTSVKLAFAGEVEPWVYQTLSPEERARLSREGYARFSEWQQQNPDIVAGLKAVAQKRLVDGFSGS